MSVRVAPMVFAEFDESYDFAGETHCISLEVRESPSSHGGPGYYPGYSPQQLDVLDSIHRHATPSNEPIQAFPIIEETPFSSCTMPKVMVRPAPSHSSTRLKTFATFPVLPRKKHSKYDNEPLPIVLVIPSDGGPPCVATPLDSKRAKAKKRDFGSGISESDMTEVMTQPAPNAAKQRRRRMR